MQVVYINTCEESKLYTNIVNEKVHDYEHKQSHNSWLYY